MTPLFSLHLFLVWFVDAVQTDICALTDVGVNKTDHGPLITVQPEDAIYDPANAITHIVMHCKADANPMASYVWYVQQTEERRPVNLNDPNITVTAGSLIVEKPSVTLHGGSYQCVASNCFGSVLSNEARLSFSYLNDFPRSLRNPVTVREFTGVGIECLPPRSGYDYTELLYSWFKDTLDVPVRSDVQWNTFASQDGKLYFQFVTKDDAGTYYCVVRRPTNAMGDIPEGKVSQPIPLHVVETTPSDQGLVIIDRFPRSFPLSPKTGDDVRLECFSFGTSMSQMEYWWNRTDGKPISSNANFSDYSRVMTFQSIQLSDAGQYRCSVSRQDDDLSTYGEFQLTVEAEPYFTKPLQDMNVEENSTVSWLCIANGVPAVTYDWYVNATLINETLVLPDERERFQLVDNVLTITNLRALDSGMYQCSASNEHGTRLSSAQLRVIACSPNCNISFGCYDPNTCNKCNRGYGRTSNGMCDVCGDYCNTTGCVKNGAQKCDGCDLGNELTSNNVCIPVINNSPKNMTNWTLLLLIIFSQLRHQPSNAE